MFIMPRYSLKLIAFIFSIIFIPLGTCFILLLNDFFTEKIPFPKHLQVTCSPVIAKGHRVELACEVKNLDVIPHKFWMSHDGFGIPARQFDVYFIKDGVSTKIPYPKDFRPADKAGGITYEPVDGNDSLGSGLMVQSAPGETSSSRIILVNVPSGKFVLQVSYHGTQAAPILLSI